MAPGGSAAPESAVGLDPQAERMPGRVEVDPDVLLRLEVREGRAGRERVLAGCGEIIDPDVEVHHHLLVARPGWPGRPDVGVFGLERQARAAVRRPECHPAILIRPGWPAEEPAVETGEFAGVWRVQDDAIDRESRLVFHVRSPWIAGAGSHNARWRMKNELNRPIRPPPTVSQA